MKANFEKVTDILKKQAQIFLLEANEFFPFGTYINNTGAIVPVGAYFDDENTSSFKIIEFIEKYFNGLIEKGDCEIAALAINVSLKEKDLDYNALEIRYFERGEHVDKKYFKYRLNDNYVEFFD